MDDFQCPPECKNELKHLKESINKLEKKSNTDVKEIFSKINKHYKHWECAVNDRLKTSTFRWGMVIGIGVLSALLGGIYAQINAVDNNVVDLKVKSATISEKIITHMEDAQR
jgi:archaellum component FlaC